MLCRPTDLHLVCLTMIDRLFCLALPQLTSPVVTGEFLIGWFILQDYTASLKSFIAHEFGGVLLEQHEQNFRFNIPSEHLTLADIFARIEAARAESDQEGAHAQFNIQEYLLYERVSLFCRSLYIIGCSDLFSYLKRDYSVI